MACPLLWETKKVEILNGKIFIEKGHPMVRANVVQNDAMFWKRGIKSFALQLAAAAQWLEHLNHKHWID